VTAKKNTAHQKPTSMNKSPTNSQNFPSKTEHEGKVIYLYT
jgi:hypothetical protein